MKYLLFASFLVLNDVYTFSLIFILFIILLFIVYFLCVGNHPHMLDMQVFKSITGGVPFSSGNVALTQEQLRQMPNLVFVFESQVLVEPPTQAPITSDR